MKDILFLSAKQYNTDKKGLNCPFYYEVNMNHYEIIEALTGIKREEISFSDNGFLSYGYIINDGEIIFKFRKNPSVSYKNEIELLSFLNEQNLNINLQRVAFVSPDDSYLGLYGVKGFCIENKELTNEVKESIGTQLGEFLKRLHTLSPACDERCTLSFELSAWKERFIKSLPIIKRFFSEEETEKLKAFMLEEAPERLTKLGESYVFSHADLGEGNIFLDENGKVGVIDFNESCYADEAADFMDIEDDVICEAALRSYGADEELREKVKIRRLIRPLFVIETYSIRGDEAVEKYINQIRNKLL